MRSWASNQREASQNEGLAMASAVGGDAGRSAHNAPTIPALQTRRLRPQASARAVSYTHLRAPETAIELVFRILPA